MKCPICGNGLFINANLPINDSEGFGVRCDDAYACTKCGFVVIFDSQAPKRYSDYKTKLDIIDESINKKEKEINELQQRPSDMSEYEKALKKFKKRLKTLDELGITGKERRTTIEQIDEFDTFIKNGVDKNTLRKIEIIREEINKLSAEKNKLVNSIALR